MNVAIWLLGAVLALPLLEIVLFVLVALKIGFGSQSPTGDECATVFSKIRYSPRAVGDFWSGEPEQGAPKD